MAMDPEQPLSGRAWWEKRRLAFNLFVLASAVIGFALFLAAMSLPGLLRPGEDAVEPMGLCIGVLLMPAFANVALHFGYPLEKSMTRKWPSRHWGPVLYKLGLALTAALFLLPSATALLSYCAGKRG